ncbi:MAG: efflux RND transporter periplasmic adaptor subunit, partial [Candidatus Aminicenantes bacterium]|nr:efflux RND transporter periplasmic adaptor subunit [Candidatus Aminicenantes bacterium]
SGTAQNPQEKIEAAPLPVKAVPARRGELIIKLKSPGEAFTDRKIALKAEVSGVVKSLNVSEGKHVKAGEILLELEGREYRLRLEKQQALRLKYLSDLYLERQFAVADKEVPAAILEKLNKAEAEFNKASSAFQKGLVSQADFEKAEKDYEIALIEAGRKKDEIMASSKGVTGQEIEVKIAQMELDKTRIRAPFAGIITDIKISPREHIDAGRELFTLVNISQIRVKAKVLESEIGKMSVGREVDLRFSAYPGKVFKGLVEAISPIVNAEDKTCAVHISVDNPTEEIKPGMHAEVEIAAEIHKDKLLVPQESILVRGGRKLVFVVEGDLAKWRYVQIGLENEDFAEILPSERPEEMVKEGELVITEGHFTLAHDTRVTISK